MLNKIYEKIKIYIKNNYKFFLMFILFAVILNIKLPYYINAPGGLINTKDRIDFDGKYPINGNFNLTYVREMETNIPGFLFAKLNKNWDLVKKSDEILSNETIKDNKIRGKLMLEESKQNALMVALDKANIDYQISNSKLYVISVDVNADTDLKVGDQIINVNGILVNNKKEMFDVVKNENNFKINVLNDNKEYVRYANKKNFDGVELIGIMVSENKIVNSDKNIKIDFKKSETGPSGGFMLSLSLYDLLTEKDIAKGRNIAGTGTINELGFVGPIGGIKYKIKGAAKEKASIFFVPTENYDEAKKTVEEDKLKIDLVEVKHIDDAIKYLTN